MTGHETFKQLSFLSTDYLYRDSTKTSPHRDGKNCAIPACHRDNSLLKNGTRNRMAAPVTQTPSTAVPLAASGTINFMTYP